MGFLERAIRRGVSDAVGKAIGFDKSEPRGGFDYVKPEPKKKTSFMDLFK